MIGTCISLSGLKDCDIFTINRDKGKSLIEFPDNYTIIDIETTGLSLEYDEIIELSALKVRDNAIVDSFTSLVKPNCKVDNFITNLTGITNEMLENAPKIRTILKDFVDFIGDDLVIGHNINFDINFIYDKNKNCYKRIFKNNYIDTLRIAKKAIKLDRYRLIDIANYYQIGIEGTHRATKDCEITYQIFNNLKKEILSKYDNAKEFYKQNWTSNFYASDIKTNKTNFDTTNIFYDKYCVFTGTLKIPRKDAMQIIVDLGGHCSDNINKKTNFLIMGIQDYSKTVTTEKSRKMLKVEDAILKGQDITIIPEDMFYQLLDI